MLADISTPVGTILFDEQGFQYSLVRVVPEGFLVKAVAIQDGEFGEEIFAAENFSFLQRAYTVSPVVKKIGEDIKDAQHTLSNLQLEIKRLHADKIKATEEYNAISTRAKTVKELQHVFNFLDGKITHFVKVDYKGPAIETFDEFMNVQDKDVDHYKLRLLCLYGRNHGDLAWRRNQYSDGSGNKTECIPCLSLEEATAIATAICNKDFEEMRKTGRYHCTYTVECAQAIGMKVPDDIAAKVKIMKKKNIEDRKNTLTLDLAKLDAELAKIGE